MSEDGRGVACIMDAASYYRSDGSPTLSEEDAFCEWLELLGERCPRNLLWAHEEDQGPEEVFQMELAEDEADAALSLPAPNLSPVARSAVQKVVSSPKLRRGPSHLEENATVELQQREQLHLRQAIFTFFLRLGISIEAITPANIRTTKSLQVNEVGMASLEVAIPVSQTSSNRHLWWCTPTPSDKDFPMREDSPPPAKPALKLIMSPVTICHLVASEKGRIISVRPSLFTPTVFTPTRSACVSRRGSDIWQSSSLRFDRSREKRQLVRSLRQIGSDLAGGRDTATADVLLEVLLGNNSKSVKKAMRYGSIEVRDSSGNSYQSRQRSLFFACLFRWALGNVASSKTLPSCYVLARLAYPEELVAGIRNRIVSEGVIWKMIAFAQDGKISLHRELAVEDVDFDHMISKGAGGRVFLGHQKAFNPPVALRPRPMLPMTKHRGRLASKVRRRISSLSMVGSSPKPGPVFASSPDVLVAANESRKSLMTGASDVTNVAIKSTHEDYVSFNKHEFLFEARGSLESVLAEIYEPFPWKLRLKVLLVVAEVFDFLHYHKIMHRDLKSANILLGDSDSAIFVTDFGCARFFDKTYDSSALESRVGTEAEAMSDKREGWLAPEVFEMGHKYTAKVDVFSFAVVISEVLTRQPPFAQFVGSRVDIPERVAQGERPILKLPKLGFGGAGQEEECPPAIEEALISLAERCWAPNPSKRPPFSKIVPILSRLYNDC